MTTVSIFGYHPDVFPGFPALMTVNMAYGFWQCGCDVRVLMPETVSHPQKTKINQLNTSVENLDRFDADFEIRIVTENEKIEPYDLGVWQSYFADDEVFFDAFKDAGGAVLKNFPRLLTGEPLKDIGRLRGAGSRFDIIGLALLEDYRLSRSYIQDIPDVERSVLYMPRGFRSDWFDPPNFLGPPTFGIEKGVKTDNSEYLYLKPVLDRIKKEFGPIEVIGARLKDEAVTTKTLPLLSAKSFYKEFINPLWAYLMIDVNRSHQGVNATNVNGRTIYPGLYENQIIEAQLAGAAVMGHRDSLPSELVGSSRIGLRFDNFADQDRMYAFLASTIETRADVATEAINWAKKNHSVINMVRPALDKANLSSKPRDTTNFSKS